MKRARFLLLGTFAALAFAAAPSGLAESVFADLNLEELREAAAAYRRKADLLRKRIGIRDRGISEAQSRARQIVSSAEADAQQRAQDAAAAQARAAGAQAGLNAAADVLGMFGGGGYLKSAVQSGMRSGGAAAVANADAQAQAAAAEGGEALQEAHKAAAPLREQAKMLEGEKKKLALKADQYEQMADAKDLLIAAETLRKQAEETAKSAGEADKVIASARALVKDMDLW